MAAPCFVTWSGTSSALTAPLGFVATSATSGTVKTILQFHPGAQKARILEWGYLCSAVPASPLEWELIETGTVFATVTAGNIANYNDASGPSDTIATVSTSGTGYNASAEGTITASRLFAYVADGGLYFKQQFPLGREPEVNSGSALRIRATPTSAASVNVNAYIIYER